MLTTIEISVRLEFVNISGLKYVGKWTAPNSVDVSAYGATSVNQFIAVPTGSFSKDYDWSSNAEGKFGMGKNYTTLKFTNGSGSLNGNLLTFTPPSMYASSWSQGGSGNATVYIPCNVYFINP